MPTITVACARCSKPKEVKASDYNRRVTGQVFCSKPCRYPRRFCTADGCPRRHLAHGLCSVHWKQERRASGACNKTATCKQCGKSFERSDRKQVYCSPEHHAEAKRQRRKPTPGSAGNEPLAEDEDHLDRVLVRTLVPQARKLRPLSQASAVGAAPAPILHLQGLRQGHHSAARHKARAWCSHECLRRHNAGGDRDAQRLRRKGRLDAGPVTRINRVAVYERDEWRCQLCGGEVPRTAQFPDDWSASLDHVVPITAGGTHTWDNVQLAHLGCNRDKGVDVLDDERWAPAPEDLAWAAEIEEQVCAEYERCG
jgi:hypothetical protein